MLAPTKRYDDANEMFESLDEQILEDENIVKIKKLLDTTNQKESEILDDRLIQKVNDDPMNTELRFKLAENYLALSEMKRVLELLKLYDQN